MDMYVGTYTGKSDSRGIYRVRLLDDGRLKEAISNALATAVIDG